MRQVRETSVVGHMLGGTCHAHVGMLLADGNIQAASRFADIPHRVAF